MKEKTGFTVIELVIVTVFFAIVGIVLFMQKNNLQSTVRDSARKTAINAMYYNLEEVYYKANGSYPSKIESKVLRAMDPELFTDPNGVKMNEPDSDYRYEPTNCINDVCKSYTLRADLEREDDFIKTSRNN